MTIVLLWCMAFILFYIPPKETAMYEHIMIVVLFDFYLSGAFVLYFINCLESTGFFLKINECPMGVPSSGTVLSSVS